MLAEAFAAAGLKERMRTFTPEIATSRRLAVAKPASIPLHVGRPNLGSRAMFDQLVDEVWTRRWLTNDGELVRRFEADIARRTRTRHCIAVANATIGLQIAALATGMKGKVITPAFTFVATAHALELSGMKPLLCDVDARTHNLDVAKARELGESTKVGGILPVHLWGRPCDTRGLDRLARELDVPIVYDAAHAFGCSTADKPIGSFGDAEVFSFHATKFLNTAEGGAITTNNDEVAAQLRLLRNFGFAGYDKVVALGTNAKMSELHAALGLTNLASMPGFVRRNKANHALYTQLLADVPGIDIVPYASAHNHQYVIVNVDARRTSVSRDDLVANLWRHGILARRYFTPGIHRMIPYSTRRHAKLPVTEMLASNLMALPNGMAMQAKDVRRVCLSVRSAIHQRTTG